MNCALNQRMLGLINSANSAEIALIWTITQYFKLIIKAIRVFPQTDNSSAHRK